MHRIHLTTFVLAGLSLPALAQNPAATGGNKDATQVVPNKQELATGQPSVQTMDANAQRQHDRDGAAKSAGNAPPRGGKQVAAGGVRDWDAVDKNNDNLIQPEEMEAALKEVGPQAGAPKR